MTIPEYITIKNANNQTVAFLSPDDGLKDCYIDTRLNGESTLEFLLPANSEKLVEITPECKIIANNREFVLLKEDAIDFERTEDNKLWAKVMSVESWALLDTKYAEPYISNDPTNPNPATLAVIIVGGGSDLSGGIYTVGSAGHALYALLQGTGWSIGTVDVTGIHDLETEKESILSNIKKVQEIWGGYLVWDSINKTVSLRSENTWQPYNGFQIRYAKNLKHITKTQSNRLVTKMYCFGHDDLDIASVNGGVKYITNFSYTSREYVGIYKNQDIYDAQELKEKAIAELSLICRPRYLYSVKMVDLRTLPEYSHEDFYLGDMADVIDPAVGTAKVRIIRHKYNVFQPWNCELELGDPEERLVEKLKASFDTTGFINGTFTSTGKMSGQNLNDLSVTYKQLADAAVTTEKIANLAVDNTKLAALAVDASKLADSAVTSTKIANAAVGSAAIANAAIGSAHIGTGVILTAHIGDAQIVDAKIGNVSANKITTGTLDANNVSIVNLKVDRLMSTDGDDKVYIESSGLIYFTTSIYSLTPNYNAIGIFPQVSTIKTPIIQAPDDNGSYIPVSGKLVLGTVNDITAQDITCRLLTAGQSGGSYGILDLGYLIVLGSKNSLQKTQNYGDRLINAYETAEYYFGDLGFGIIGPAGEVTIAIDEIFQECVNVTDFAYHVFTQVYNGAISSIDRQTGYFTIHGAPGTEFSWEIKAKRQGYEMHRMELFDPGDEVVWSNIEGELNYNDNLENILLEV